MLLRGVVGKDHTERVPHASCSPSHARTPTAVCFLLTREGLGGKHTWLHGVRPPGEERRSISELVLIVGRVLGEGRGGTAVGR